MSCSHRLSVAAALATAVLLVSSREVVAQPCSACGPGAHWIDGCPGGNDVISTSALVGIDTNLDCIADTILILGGPVTIQRTAAINASVNFPTFTGPPGHAGPDVIDTEIVSMQLIGGGISLRAGGATNPGPNGKTISLSKGTIPERTGDPTIGESFFDVFFEVHLGGTNYAYNHTPIRVSSPIECVPPATTYIHESGCVDLFSDPVGGVLVARLTIANHNTFGPGFNQNVPVEYSNTIDEMAIAGGGAHNGADPLQVLYTLPIDGAGPPFPADSQDFGLSGDVDGLANNRDAFFHSVVVNAADLVVSFANDPANPPGNAVYFETPLGVRGLKWAQMHFSNPDPPGDVENVDALELWGPMHDGTNPLSGWDANMYSVLGEPAGTSVFAFPGVAGPPVPFVTQAQIHAACAALGFAGAVNQVDVDGLMVSKRFLLNGMSMAFGPGDTILFSIRAAANFDGGEIIVLPFGAAPFFLNHGGHLWDTAFNVSAAFGIPTEEVDAIEAMPPKGEPYGCCKLAGPGTSIETPDGCLLAGGDYQGDDTLCNGSQQGVITSVPPIPTVSAWGVAALSLLVLIAGTVVLRRSRQVAA